MPASFVLSPTLHLFNQFTKNNLYRQCSSKSRQLSAATKHSISSCQVSPVPFPRFNTLGVEPSPENLEDKLLRAAQEAADAAGAILVDHFRQSVPVDYKSDDSPVTKADRLAEAAIRDVIRSAFPDHVIIGEEMSETFDPYQPGYAWVIDPIDDTRAFVCGRPTFATLISVLHRGAPIIGIINQPYTKERWVGVINRQTTLNGTPVAVRACESLDKCIVQATTPQMFTGLDGVLFRRISRLARNVVYGGDCYAYAMLASGCGDVVIEADLKVWDFLALVPIVEGAGGVMADWGGAPLTLFSDGRVVASSSHTVFEEIISELAVAEEEFGLVRRTIQVSDNISVSSGVLPEDPGPGNIESMTGYGRSLLEQDGYLVRVQVRSVNSRYCEVHIRGAGVLSSYEGELANMVKKMSIRGRINVNIDVDFNGNEEPKKVRLATDDEAVKVVAQMLKNISMQANLPEPTVSDVLRFPEVMVKQDSAFNPGELLPIVKKAIVLATQDMQSSRRREGALLEEDIVKRTRKITHILDDISQRASDRVVAERSRLKKILDDIVDREVSAPRIETEVTLFANRVDFTEEVVRLQAHIEVFELTLLGVDEPIGQRLGFLLQEMHREANTLGSKASDAPVSHLVVLIKEEIEKIREQCSNLQ